MNGGYYLTEQEILDENDRVEQAKKKPELFGVLYDKYFQPIFNFIYRRTDDEETAADITSQTFFKALSNLKKYEFRGLPFSAWLFRIAANEVNKYYYKSGKNPVFSIEENRVKQLVADVETEDLENKIQLVLEVFREAPKEIVEVLELRFFEGKNFKEIAFILNISESGAKMRTYRSLEKLKQIILSKPGYEQE